MESCPELAGVDLPARTLGVSRKRVYALVSEGVFPAGVIVRVGTRIYFNSDRFAEWIEAGGTSGAGVHTSAHGGGEG